MSPYKYKFRRVFYSYLKSVNTKIKSPKTVLDAACARGKFINRFNNDYYMGVDLDVNRISFLKDRYRDRHKFFVMDLVNDCLPCDFSYQGDCGEAEQVAGGFDLVISTHTFSHIAPENHFGVIDNLLNSLSKEGFIILQINSRNIETITYLKKKVYIERESCYRGEVSRFVESHFSKAFRKTRAGRYLNQILSFVDLGRQEIVILCTKNLDALSLPPKKAPKVRRDFPYYLEL